MKNNISLNSNCSDKNVNSKTIEENLGKKVKRRKVNVIPVPEYEAIEIKKIRESLNLSPMIFAEALGVSLKTVEAWEYGKNTPNKPTCRLLQLLEINRFLLNEQRILLPFNDVPKKSFL